MSGRRGLLVIGALVLAAMGVTAAIVLGVGSGEDGGGGPRAEPPPGKRFRAKALGIRGRVPKGWRVRRTRRTIRFTAPGRSGLVAISTTPFAVSRSALLSSTLAAIRRSYRRVAIYRRGSGKLGGLPARTANAAARNARRVRVDLVLATAKAPRRSYLLQAIVAHGAPANRVIEAQRIVNSLRLSG